MLFVASEGLSIKDKIPGLVSIIGETWQQNVWIYLWWITGHLYAAQNFYSLKQEQKPERKNKERDSGTKNWGKRNRER